MTILELTKEEINKYIDELYACSPRDVNLNYS